MTGYTNANSSIQERSEHMNFRHEWKHEINALDLLVLRQRLRAVAQPDSHAVAGRYHIRSLYFDSPSDKALREKIDGVNRREKFRIRYYDDNISLIHLEKKCKINGLCQKYIAPLTDVQVQEILEDNLSWMPHSPDPLVVEFYTKLLSQRLSPKIIVDYTREPFVYAPGNVRVTMDYHIRTSSDCSRFLSPQCVTLAAGDPVILLEVKWDTFLPSVIQRAIQLEGRCTSAFSKYARGRLYG